MIFTDDCFFDVRARGHTTHSSLRIISNGKHLVSGLSLILQPKHDPDIVGLAFLATPVSAIFGFLVVLDIRVHQKIHRFKP